MMKRAHEIVGTLALALALFGCSTKVIGGGGGGGGGGGDGPESVGGGDAPNAVAMRFSQWTPPSSSPGDTFAFQLGGPPTPPDPNALMLFFASKEQTCAAPHLDIANPSTDPAVCAQQAFWQVVVVIPPERVQPGVIDLQDPSIVEYRATWAPECGGGSGGGPSWVVGKLTITSVDSTKVVTKLDLDPSTGWQGESGDYTAMLCP